MSQFHLAVIILLQTNNEERYNKIGSSDEGDGSPLINSSPEIASLNANDSESDTGLIKFGHHF